MSELIDSKRRYLDAHAAAAGSLPGRDIPWVRALRARGAECFSELGLPTSREESWKYTSLAPTERYAFMPARTPGGVTRAQADAMTFETLDAHRLVFIDGRYAPEFSASTPLPSGVVACGLAEAFASEPEYLEPHLARVAAVEVNGLAALNTAFLADGAYLRVARGVSLDKPVHLVFIATAAELPLVQPRNLYVLEENSHATVIEHYVTAAETRYFTNALTEVALARAGSLEHYRVQQESAQAVHVGRLHARLARDSRFTSHAIDLGGLLVRNDLNAMLDAEGAECTLNGLYVVGDRAHVDNHTQVDHAKPRGTSREFYKGVLDGRARAVFNGRVVVHPDAQHTDAQQVNNNLLLSRDAEIDTKPELEIYADDVKCSHGATVGSLDPNELFYLRSRGLDAATARDLLTYAFAHDVLRHMRLAPIRLHLERRLNERLLAGRAIKELELI